MKLDLVDILQSMVSRETAELISQRFPYFHLIFQYYEVRLQSMVSGKTLAYQISQHHTSDLGNIF